VGDEPLAVVVGRLSHQKGQDVMLRAWDETRAQVPGAALVLVGDGPERERLESGAPAGVRFAGQVADAAGWLAAADVVVMPSRWEGAPLVLLEAMARARSVVATDVAGAAEAVAPGCGEVVPVGDHHALARAAAERLLDRERADREGAAGRRRVEQSYDARTSCERMAEVYEEVLARRPVAAASRSTRTSSRAQS
jgi:glycosyltransferase involved in cell wall biosynthesis